MGLKTSGQLSDWSVLTGCSARLALTAALTIALGTAILEPAGAETTTGLVIEQNGSQVNVRYNPEALANFDITRRGDDTTIIRIPHAQSGALPFRLVVDPRLKSGNIVQENETSRGRVITIHSQQVYTISQDDLGGVVLANNPTPVATSSPKAANAGPPTPRSITSDTKLAEKPQPKAAASQPTSAKSGTSTAKTLQQPAKAESADAAKKTASTQPEPTGESPEKNSQTSVEQEAQTSAAAASPNIVAPEDDPEMQPLNLSGDKQQKADNTATGMMLRATISLLAVLALLFVFMRRVLPELMNRYPRFFENLRRRHQADQARASSGRSPILGLPRPFADVDETDLPDDQAFEAIAKNARARFQPPTNRPSSQKQLLTHFGQDDEHFHVLTSAPLGKGRELHLVEIKGRQLVVATTPYTVSLIKDLSEPDYRDDGTAGQADEANNTADTDIHPLLSHSPSIAPLAENQSGENAMGAGTRNSDRHVISMPAERPAAGPSSSATGRTKSNVHAYLEDDPAPIEARRPQAKPFASGVSTSKLPEGKASGSPGRQAMENNASTPNPLDRLYMKYLPPEELDAERERAQSQRRSVSANIESLLAEERQNAGIIDTEDVVILEDYDDTYER